jgi:hypothetical protein
MRKILFAIVITLFSYSSAVSGPSAHGEVTLEDVRAAIDKGTISKPNPPVLRFIANSDAAELYEQVKDYLVWFKYKGVLYSTLFGPQFTQVVVFSPNGGYANGSSSGSYFVIPNQYRFVEYDFSAGLATFPATFSVQRQ